MMRMIKINAATGFLHHVDAGEPSIFCPFFRGVNCVNRCAWFRLETRAFPEGVGEACLCGDKLIGVTARPDIQETPPDDG